MINDKQVIVGTSGLFEGGGANNVGLAAKSAFTAYLGAVSHSLFTVQASWGTINAADGTLIVSGGNEGTSGRFESLTSGTMTAATSSGKATTFSGLGYELLQFCWTPSSVTAGTMNVNVTRKRT